MKGGGGRAIWALFALAAVLRIGWVCTANRDALRSLAFERSSAGIQLTYDDEVVYWSMARNLVSTGRLVTDDGRYAARMPLYPLFLTAFAVLGDGGILVAKLMQALLGAIGVLWVYWFANAVGGARAGWLAGLAAAVDPFAIFFSNLLLTEALFSVALVGIAFCFWAVLGELQSLGAGERGSGGHGRPYRIAEWGLALLGAVAVLMRPSVAGLIVVLVLMLLMWRRPAWTAVRTVGLTALVLAAVLAPWGLRNQAVIGSPALLSTNGGVTLYDSVGPQARGDSDQSFLHDMPELAQLGERAADDELRRRALRSMQDNPGRVLELAGIKFCRTWSLTPNVAEHRGGATALASAIYTGGILFLAALGVWSARRVRGFNVAVLTPVLYFTLVHMVYVGSVRYRVPVMPLLAVAAGAARMQNARLPAPQ